MSSVVSSDEENVVAGIGCFDMSLLGIVINNLW